MLFPLQFLKSLRIHQSCMTVSSCAEPGLHQFLIFGLKIILLLHRETR